MNLEWWRPRTQNVMDTDRMQITTGMIKPGTLYEEAGSKKWDIKEKLRIQYEKHQHPGNKNLKK